MDFSLRLILSGAPNKLLVILSEAYFSGAEGPAFAFQSQPQPICLLNHLRT
jgi:hypothetical protein